MKRSHLKRFSSEMVNVGRAGVEKGVHEDALQLTAFKRMNVTTFMQEFPASAIDIAASAGIDLQRWAIVPRVQALRRMAEFRRGVDAKHHTVIETNKRRTLKLYFTIKKDEWFYVEELHLEGNIRRSIPYANQARANQVMRSGKICWVEYKTIKNILVDEFNSE